MNDKTDIKNSSILIIDDLPIGFAPLSLILEKEGHTVIFYDKSENAISFIEEVKPDLIILDILMPEISGLTLCIQIKSYPKTKDIPIIFVTAKDDRDTELEALKQGGVDYLIKPIHPLIAKEKIYIQLKIKQLQNELYSLSNTDSLTNLFNRRYLMSSLEENWRNAIKYQNIIGLMLIDIDHFKNYNDYYGHAQGDTCLKKVASIISKTTNVILQEKTIVGRYGGEEFLIIIPNTNQKEMENLATNIKEKVLSSQIPHEKSPVNSFVTLSIGGHFLKPNHGTSEEDIFFQTDLNLYASKKKGRNHFTISSPS